MFGSTCNSYGATAALGGWVARKPKLKKVREWSISSLVRTENRDERETRKWKTGENGKGKGVASWSRRSVIKQVRDKGIEECELCHLELRRLDW